MALLGFKVSLLASYLRIGGFVESYKRIIQVVIVACVCNQIAFTLALLLGCQPVCTCYSKARMGCRMLID